MYTRMTQAKEREGQVEVAVTQLGGKTVLERERAGTRLSRLLSGISLTSLPQAYQSCPLHCLAVERVSVTLCIFTCFVMSADPSNHGAFHSTVVDRAERLKSSRWEERLGALSALTVAFLLQTDLKALSSP